MILSCLPTTRNKSLVLSVCSLGRFGNFPHVESCLWGYEYHEFQTEVTAQTYLWGKWRECCPTQTFCEELLDCLQLTQYEGKGFRTRRTFYPSSYSICLPCPPPSLGSSFLNLLLPRVSHKIFFSMSGEAQSSVNLSYVLSRMFFVVLNTRFEISIFP